ncbi:MAG: recombination regulator RecX [Orrella sp.]
MGQPNKQVLLKKPALKIKAVAWLARREHTRAELVKKLQPLAEDPDDILAVLEELRQGGWQSDERFARAFTHHKSQRQGAALVAQGMRQKGVPDEMIADTLQALAGSEYGRARDVWEKKFARQGPPTDHKSWARQARFLASRGFAADVIRRVLGSKGDPDND